MKRPALPPAIASHLLWAAATLDAVFVFSALQVLEPLVLAMIELGFPGLSRQFSSLDSAISQAFNVILTFGCFLILLVLYWTVVEIPLAGRSLGRSVMGMKLRQLDGQRPKAFQLTKRAFRKITSLGLAGLAVGRFDNYDEKNGLVWCSPLVEGNLSASRNLRIEVLSGTDAGTSHELDQLVSFRKHRGVKIGRDKFWADILLNRDGNVSNQHALIRLRQSGWQIKDYGGGKGSRNKTRVNGQVLPPLQWCSLKVGDVFQVANVQLRLSK